MQKVRATRIRAPEVASILGCAKSTVWSWVKTRPGFPQPRKEGNHFTYWLRSEVEAYAVSGFTDVSGEWQVCTVHN